MSDQITEETKAEIQEAIEESIQEAIEETKSPELPAQNLELGILVGQMAARLEALESENKILAAKIQELEWVQENQAQSITGLYSEISGLIVKQDEIKQEIEETEKETAAENEETSGSLIEIEIPPEPEKPTETKQKKRHFI